jgi:hypothetical protein
LWEFGRYSPAGSSVEAATAPSRRDVKRKQESVCETQNRNIEKTFIEKFEYKVEKKSTMSENFTIFAL